MAIKYKIILIKILPKKFWHLSPADQKQTFIKSSAIKGKKII